MPFSTQRRFVLNLDPSLPIFEALPALQSALADAAVQDKLARAGLRVRPGAPGELQALLVSEIQRWGGVIRAAKIEPE